MTQHADDLARVPLDFSSVQTTQDVKLAPPFSHITYTAMKEFAQTMELGMRILTNCDELNRYPQCKIGRIQTTRLHLSAGARANYTHKVNLQLCGLAPQRRRIITALMLHITVRACSLSLKYPFTLGSSQFLQDIDQSLRGRLATFPLPIV